jgi:hypothetical protein
MEKNKAIKCARHCWKHFCLVLFCKKNLWRDLFFLAVLIIFLGIVLTNKLGYFKETKTPEIAPAVEPEPPMSEQEAVQKAEEQIPKIQARINTSSWTPYQNVWYGFSLKYPKEWADPIAQKAPVGVMWEQKIQFRTAQTSDADPFEGFDVVVYAVAKVKELSNTEEFPRHKNAEFSAQSECASIEGHLLETGDYPAEEVYIPISDACYNAALFFTNTRGAYIYNVTPKIKDGMGLAGDPAREIEAHLPEFFSVASTWDLIDIQRPKPAPPKPKITAPFPVSYKVVNGRLVCAKKSDHPSKSKQNKGKHLDMECCLDPDEYPNPHCYYPPDKYGKYL